MDSGRKYRQLVHSRNFNRDRKLIEGFLSERPIDKDKLANFSKNSVLPDTYRVLVWKVLLDISPKYAESHDYNRQQQKLIFDDLWRTLKVLHLRGYNNVVSVSNGNYNGLSNGSFDSTESSIPEPDHYLFMWLINTAKLLHNAKYQLRTSEHQRYITIAHKLSSYFDDPVDLFHFYSALWTLLQINEGALLSTTDDAIALLRKHDTPLHVHLLRIKVFSSDILQYHCLTLFCDIFPESAVEKVLDKIIAKSFKIIAYVLLYLLLHLKPSLHDCNTVESIRNCLLQLRKEEADLIVKKALDHGCT